MPPRHDVAMQESRELKALPLNETARIAMRETQEEKALVIENKRRKAKGEELLTSLDEEEEATEETDTEAATDEQLASSDVDAGVDADADADVDTNADVDHEEDDKGPDVLLTEAGNVLIDALLLQEQRLVVNEGG